jgi:hypothetical protein
MKMLIASFRPAMIPSMFGLLVWRESLIFFATARLRILTAVRRIVCVAVEKVRSIKLTKQVYIDGELGR